MTDKYTDLNLALTQARFNLSCAINEQQRRCLRDSIDELEYDIALMDMLDEVRVKTIEVREVKLSFWQRVVKRFKR